MKSIICILTAVGLLLSALPVWASAEEQAAFYHDCITKRIDNCQKKAMLKSSRSPCLQHCALINAKQAKFLKQNREKLVHEMVRKNVKMKPYAVDYYLITTFFASME